MEVELGNGATVEYTEYQQRHDCEEQLHVERQLHSTHIQGREEEEKGKPPQGLPLLVRVRYFYLQTSTSHLQTFKNKIQLVNLRLSVFSICQKSVFIELTFNEARLESLTGLSFRKRLLLGKTRHHLKISMHDL